MIAKSATKEIVKCLAEKLPLMTNDMTILDIVVAIKYICIKKFVDPFWLCYLVEEILS